MPTCRLSPIQPKHLTTLLQPLHPPYQNIQTRLHRQLSTLTNNVNYNYSRKLHTTSNPTTKPTPKEPNQPTPLYALSLSLSQTPIIGTAQITYTQYTTTGTPAHPQTTTKSALATRYGLTTRDLRTVDLPSDGFPHILIRENTLLIHMFKLRLLVQADHVLLFKLGDGDEEENAVRVFCHDLEGKLGSPTGTTGLPYELRVLETALTAVTSTLEAEYLLSKKGVSAALRRLDLQMLEGGERKIHSELRTLLDLVRGLAGIERRARHVRSVVQEVLNDDRDMADMYLSDKVAGNPHAIQDHQDVEYLLEAYYKSSDGVVQEATSLMVNIRQTEETIRSILDVRRNQIMVLEAKIEIVMLALGAATLVAGLYGMNVVNYFEESAWAFGGLVCCCLVGTALISRFGMRQLRHIQKVHL